MDPYKLCPGCGQPSRATDLKCLKCGHEFRLDLNQAKAAAGADAPPIDVQFTVLSSTPHPRRSRTRIRVSSPGRALAALAGVIVSLVTITAAYRLANPAAPAASPYPAQSEGGPDRAFDVSGGTYEPPVLISEVPTGADLWTQRTCDQVYEVAHNHVKSIGPSARAFMRQMGAPYECAAGPDNVVSMISYRASDGKVSARLNAGRIRSVESYPNPVP